jgi:hypothetical protein
MSMSFLYEIGFGSWLSTVTAQGLTVLVLPKTGLASRTKILWVGKPIHHYTSVGWMLKVDWPLAFRIPHLLMILFIFLISDKKKYKSPSKKRCEKKFNANQGEIWIAIKKRKIIARWVHLQNVTTPSSDPTLNMNPAEKSAHICAEFKQKICDWFGLPKDTTFISQTKHGKKKYLCESRVLC